MTRYRVGTSEWSCDPLKIAVLSDLHVCTPWVPIDLVSKIVEAVNDIGADMIVLLGDYLADRRMPFSTGQPADQIISRLSELRAPRGVYAIMGNHDYKDCPLHYTSGGTRSSVVEAFAETDISLMRNESLQISHEGSSFWLVALDSQRAVGRDAPGFEDPDAAFRNVPQTDPTILLAHEPDYFATNDTRAFLQISGHTHAGQLNLFGWRPMTPSAYGGRYAIGHIEEGDRHLVVSTGIGYSGLPMRVGAPPEITLIDVVSDSGTEGRKND